MDNIMYIEEIDKINKILVSHKKNEDLIFESISNLFDQMKYSYITSNRKELTEISEHLKNNNHKISKNHDQNIQTLQKYRDGYERASIKNEANLQNIDTNI